MCPVTAVNLCCNGVFTDVSILDHIQVLWLPLLMLKFPLISQQESLWIVGASTCTHYPFAQHKSNVRCSIKITYDAILAGIVGQMLHLTL